MFPPPPTNKTPAIQFGMHQTHLDSEWFICGVCVGVAGYWGMVLRLMDRGITIMGLWGYRKHIQYHSPRVPTLGL